MNGCNTSIADIMKECKKRFAPGILQKLYIAGSQEITLIPLPDADTCIVSQDITFRPADAAATPPVEAGSWAEWAISRADQSFETEQDDNGTYVTTASFYIMGQTPEKGFILKNIGEDANVLIVPDKEGFLRIVGDLNNPADVKVKEQYTPKNGYILTITWESGAPPLYYTGAITT